jgi:ketosteroid isomerase-like protein
MKTITLILVLLLIVVNTASAFDINPYHRIVKKLVRNNFKAIEEHRPEEIMSGVSDKSLEHRFAGDNSLIGTRHDKESLLKWFKRVNIVLPDLKFEITDIKVKGGPGNTLVIARWTATCTLLNGEAYENKGVHFITLKWGKAVKFDVYENTKVVSHGLDVQFEAGIKEAKAPKIES